MVSTFEGSRSRLNRAGTRCWWRGNTHSPARCRIRRGVVSISLFMGGDTTPSSAVVQTAGHAYRLEGHLLKQGFNRVGMMQPLLLRYTPALITKMSQTPVCHRHP